MAYSIYDDSKQLIATGATKNDAIASLLIYFRSLGGINYAATAPINTPCSFDAIFRVNAKTPLPKFLYINGLTENAKVFPKQLSKTFPNFDSLCNGVTTNNQVVAPFVSGKVTESADVVAPVISSIVTEDANTYILSITPHGNWVVFGTYISAVNYAGIVTLNISLRNTTISTHTLFSGEYIFDISSRGIPNNPIIMTNSTTPNIPAGSTLINNAGAPFNYSGYETSIDPITGNVVLELFNIQYNVNN